MGRPSRVRGDILTGFWRALEPLNPQNNTCKLLGAVQEIGIKGAKALTLTEPV